MFASRLGFFIVIGASGGGRMHSGGGGLNVGTEMVNAGLSYVRSAVTFEQTIIGCILAVSYISSPYKFSHSQIVKS